MSAWDLADLHGDGTTSAVFKDLVDAVSISKDERRQRQIQDLENEQRRRQTRPDVAPAREDLQLSKDRFGFWSLAGDGDWDFIAEGGFGKVYRVPAFPPIQGVAGSKYDEVAIKAAKVGADGELKGETEGLAQLTHKHIVSILGFTYCAPALGESERWLMILEFCHSDLEKLLYGDTPKGVMYAVDREHRSPRDLMLTLSLQIAQGMQYIHAASTQHLDLKPENAAEERRYRNAARMGG